MSGARISPLLPPRGRRAALPKTLTRPCPISQGPARRCCGPIQRCDQQPPIKRLAGLGQAGLQALASRVDGQAARECLPASRIAFSNASAWSP